MHDTRMQHAREAHIGRPVFLGSHFQTDSGILERLANDLVFADRFHWRISVNRQPDDSSKASANRYRELQLLVLDQGTVRNALTASRDDAILHGQLVFRHSESF